MKVSVNIITKNRPQMLRRAVESVLNQSFKDYEIVIVDNAGNEVAEEYVKELDLPNIFCYKCPPTPYGLSYARNLGLEKSKGEYIAILDDDDIWIDKDKLVQQIDYLDAYKKAVLVGTNIFLIKPDGTLIGKRIYPSSDLDIRWSILEQNQFCHSTVLYKKEPVMKIGGYQQVEGLWNINEYKLWLELATMGAVRNLPMISTKYTVWDKSIATFGHRFKLYAKDFKLAYQYRHDYPYFYKAIWRYLIKYPFIFTFRRKWWD